MNKDFKLILNGFSLIELLISLIVISCITAAFTPVITKKLKTSAVSLNAASSEITTECTDKFSSSCKLCTKSYCIQCELSNCAVGKYTENKTCSCKDCSNLFSDCVECNSAKCTKCLQTHYIKDNKCEPCPSGKICDGVNAHDASYCTNPPAGFFCEGTTLKKCTDKYNSLCAECDSTKCTKCQIYYFLSGGNTCTRCSNSCVTCDSQNHCTECAPDTILEGNKCERTCSGPMPNCLYCSNASTCTKCEGGYYINSSNTCSPCNDNNNDYLTNCIACDNATTCTKCKKGFYVTSENKCEQCKIANCAQCNKDNACISCNQGYHLSSDKSRCEGNDNKFNCSDSNFMQIGNLCVTRKNMGDSTMLTIPSTVNIAQAGSDYCYSQSQKCCWKGQNTTQCDSANGGYSGCNRTVCNYDAAKEICAKFNYGGKTWRLPTSAEMKNWAYNSIALEGNGLMLCDSTIGFSTGYSSGVFSSAWCATQPRCLGTPDSGCYTGDVWGDLINNLNAYFYLFQYEVWMLSSSILSNAFSVRCVTEME